MALLQFRLDKVSKQAGLFINSACFMSQNRLDCTPVQAELQMVKEEEKSETQKVLKTSYYSTSS